MCDHHDHDQSRRDLLKLAGALGLVGLAGPALAANDRPIGAMVPGQGWVPADAAACAGDGTPLQFIPRTAPDPDPLTDELKKYPRCPYCGMDRTEYQHSRHLVQYDDNLVDGVCSIHCLAISLALNMDRGPKAMYAADFGSTAAIKPLISVDAATYLIGSKLKGTMSAVSKLAFADKAAAEAAKAEQGGELGSFDAALSQSYLSMAKDTVMIRKNRAEKLNKMMEKKGT
ncbi:nitrous oxide reductase accessory protein NosL [uncultured Lamprocystis sp.]|jgi:nitrous oxide reductase accessory protein NosL|uniref:nitrous oxide reductase accessory protein NosL n=1 Tax=uncultured Lamprocystis sp. TaxID=543132 RepID=UPI0025D2CF73|nr:nitrous oxide reductase accessory protein NosL [uncultured Lamprocystis sp.]